MPGIKTLPFSAEKLTKDLLPIREVALLKIYNHLRSIFKQKIYLNEPVDIWIDTLRGGYGITPHDENIILISVLAELIPLLDIQLRPHGFKLLYENTDSYCVFSGHLKTSPAPRRDVSSAEMLLFSSPSFYGCSSQDKTPAKPAPLGPITTHDTHGIKKAFEALPKCYK